MRPSWRALARIGWRDACRHRASSVLIAVLVGLPVLAVAAGAVLVATDAAVVEHYRRAEILGGADVVLQVPDQATAEAVQGGLPAGAVSQVVREGRVQLDVSGDNTWLPSMAADVANPLQKDRIRLVDGRAPTAEEEIALTPAVLRQHMLGIGDTVPLLWPHRSATVVGVVVRPGALDASLLVTAPEVGWAVGGLDGEAQVYVDAGPDDIDAVERAAHQAGANIQFADWWGPVGGPSPEADRVDFVFVAGGLALFEVALVVAAAVAVRARRQLRTLGLMSAVGATSHQRARVIVASTVLVAAPGALVGLASGVALGHALVPLLDRVTDRLHSDAVVPIEALLTAFVVGVVAAAVAAGVPARSASRLSTRHALAARRPVTPWPTGYVVMGVATVVLGFGVAFAGATAPANGWVILAGSVLVVAGVAAVSPPLLGLVGRLAGRMPTTLRLVVRDMARHRSRTGPAVAAAMAALALPIAVSTFVLSMQAAGRTTPLTTGATEAASAVVTIRSATTPTGAPPEAALATIGEELPWLEGSLVNDTVGGALQEVWVAPVDRLSRDPSLPGWIAELGRGVDPGLDVEISYGAPVMDAAVVPLPSELLLPLALMLCAVVALGIVGVATALNLYEARDDLQTLRSVGASPRLRWRFAMAQGALIAGLGALLAIPAGAVPAGAVIASRAELGPVVPWAAIGTVVVVVPVLASVFGHVMARTMPVGVTRRLT